MLNLEFHFTIFTSWVCPESTERQSYSKLSLVSQIQMVLSLEQEARYFPSWEKDTHFTSFSWPSRVETHSYSSPEFSQRLVVPSKLQLARILPVGSNSILLIDLS